MKSFALLLLTMLLAAVSGCGYGSSTTVTPPQAGTAPTIAQLMPNNVTAGGAAFVLTVNGTNFATNAAVNWNGTAQTTTYVTGSQLTTSIPASAITTSGTVAVTVTNPAVAGGLYGGGTTAATSTSVTFTIN
jgi:hypothetical protein